MKKEAYYFSHDGTAQDDPKCMLLIDQLGMEGYGIYWGLIERLRGEPNYRLPMSVCSAYARRWNTSKEKVEAVIKSFNLFEIEESSYFFSIRLRRSMMEKSATGTKNALSRWNRNATAMQLHSDGNATAMQTDAIKVKERKVKESKEKERVGEVAPPPSHPLCLFVSSKLKNVSLLKNQLSDEQAQNLVAKFDKGIIQDVLYEMENKKDLAKKYTSVNLTIQSWIKIREKNIPIVEKIDYGISQ